MSADTFCKHRLILSDSSSGTDQVPFIQPQNNNAECLACVSAKTTSQCVNLELNDKNCQLSPDVIQAN